MSSTKRGLNRLDLDQYQTPRWPIARLLEELSLPGGLWWEPNAGEGNIIRAVNNLRQDVTWVANEIRPECAPMLAPITRSHSIADLRTLEDAQLCSMVAPNLLFDVTITNPAFVIAQEVIEKAFLWSRWVVMLLRLNYLGGAVRNDFMREFAPDIYTIPDRPSFEGEGSDSIYYSFYVWPPEKRRREGIQRVLKTTPLAQRKEDRMYTDALRAESLRNLEWMSANGYA